MNRVDVSRRAMLIGAGLLSGQRFLAPLAAMAQQHADVLTPEMFGARGDGVTNDTDAFKLLSQAVAQRGGGTIALRRTTYVVGLERPDPQGRTGWAFAPDPILSFVALPGALIIQGNGATLRCAAGLRYGTFDPATGAPTSHHGLFIGPRERASPYDAMIRIERSAGPVSISDLELDGNLQRLVIGGTYGDTGRQIAGSGILLIDNGGDEILRNVYVHHHGEDGIIISGIDDAGLAGRVTRRAEGVRSEFNARQGCSIVGGRNWHFSRCRFAHTGRARFDSAPGAGVDIEAEGGKKNRDHAFEDCEFVDNTGCGIVADTGNSEGATFTRCRFIGTIGWAAWPNKPRFAFHGCTFVGSIVRCFGDPDRRRAAQFYDCVFTDDPRLSPTHQVYREGRADGSLADLSSAQNVLFQRCRFLAVGGAVLPWSTGAIYDSCMMRQTNPAPAYPRGTYIGRNVIDGHVDLYGSHVQGTVVRGATVNR